MPPRHPHRPAPAAALYAVYPPAVTYGSLDYLDPPLAPLLALFLLGVLNLRRGPWVWAGVGLASGLLLATKQTGMMALPLVPAVALLFGPRSGRGLAVWAGTALLVLCLVADPLAYVHGLRHPSRPIGELHLDPLSLLAGNAGSLARPEAYYWLSFARHGEPLAPFFARVHPLLTPACLAVYAFGLVAALAGGAGRRLLVLYAPAALTLAAILPSDGLWRFHLLSPLVCVGAALELARLPGRRGVAALVVAGLAAAPALVPQRPGADGTVDLADLVRTNPQAPQLQRFHGPAFPLVVWLSPGTMLERRVWLAPGDYDVSVAATSPAVVSLDGRPVLGAGGASTPLALDGFVHRLAFSFPGGGVLRRLAIRRLDGNAPQIGAHRRTASG